MRPVRALPMLLATFVVAACAAGEKTIALKQNIHHDDFEYSVQSAARVGQIGDKAPAGVFYVVAFRVQNDAKRVSHEWANDVAYVVDDQGRAYENDRGAQARLNALSPFGYKDKYVTPAGTVATTMFVFDLPATATAAYLKVRGEVLMGDIFDGRQFAHTRVKLF